MRSWTKIDVVRLTFIFLLGLMFVSLWGEVVPIGVLGLGLVGLVVLGATIFVLRDHYLSAPSPDLTELDGVSATIIRREPVAFSMGWVVVGDLVAVTLVWALLALRDAPGLAVILCVPTLWAAGFAVLMGRGRFTVGSAWFTPEKFVYRSRGLVLEIRWDDIEAADGDAVPGLAVVYARNESAFTHNNVPSLWRSERMASPSMAVIRTDDMAVDPGTLVRFIGRYALDPSARWELGTPRSLATLEAGRLTTTSGPLANAFARRRPEHHGA